MKQIYSFRVVLSFLLLSLSFSLSAQYSAVPLTSGSFNSDVVANGTTNVDATATTTDAVDGTATSNFVFVTPTFYPSAVGSACSAAGGFPSTLTSTNATNNSGITYTFQSPTGNNALRLPNANSGTMTFSTPTSASTLYLVCLGGNGATTFSVQVNFSDASTETINGLSAPDWCGGAATYKVTATQYFRIPRSATACTSGALCQYLYEVPVAISSANYGKTINSITLTNTTGNVWLNVFAVGKQSTCAAPAAQPTGLTPGSITAGSIAGSFTAATGSPAATGYLVVRYPSAAAVTTPTTGVTYTTGQTIGLGTVVQANATTSFTASGLTGGTAYSFYVYSYSTGGTCGGPSYLTASPLTATYTTTACSGVAGGTYTVGPTGTYANITTALGALNTGMSGSVVLELQTTYAGAGETYPIAFNTSSCIGAGKTLTIRPITGATNLFITSANTTGTVNFNGATYVTIDGRPGGVGTSQLTIANTNAGTSYAVNLTNDASNNTLKYCTVTSRNTSATSGTIVFGVGGTVTGNDNNTIDNCSITDDGNGTTFPANGIYSLGTSAAIDNSSNSVTNCNISNYFSTTVSSAGILLGATGNSGWTISTNRFFQTATRVYTTAQALLSAITVGVGSGYAITNNIIGFNSAAGTAGTYTSIIGNTVTLAGFPTSYATAGTPNATRYIGINCAFTAAGTASNIQGNTIAGLALYTSSGATTTYGILCGIQVTAGNANIGTTTANTIGSTAAGLGSLYAANTSGGGTVVGIYATSANTVSIQNNTIGSIDASGTTASLNGGITGIDVAGAGSYTINSNLIGNTTAGNLRTGYVQNGANLGAGGTTLTSTTGAAGALVGIRSAATGLTVAINSNTLRGFITSGTVSAFTGITVTGINTYQAAINSNSLGTAGTGLINYTVANSGALTGITFPNTGAATTSHSIQTNDFRGITHTVQGSSAHTYINTIAGTGANNVTTISNNTFTNLNVNTTGNVTFIGHSYTVGSGGTQTINNNSIVTAFNKGGAGGTVTCMSSAASTILASATVTHTNNNFSNITVTGATTLNGINNTDGTTSPAVNRTITGNTFNTWTGGTSAVTVMSYTYWGGTTSTVSSNTITNITGQGAITGLSIGSSANSANPLTISSNTITGLTSNTTGGNVIGLTCANTSPVININSNTIGTLSSIGATSTVQGLVITGATITNVNNNKISGLSGTGTGTPVATGIAVSGGTTVNLNRNQICDIGETGTFTTATTAVMGMSLTGGTTVTAYSNIIGDLKAPSTTNGDAIRGISVTGGAGTSFNVYNNTIFMEAAISAATVFGTTGIYHTASATTTLAKLDLRNNLIVNKSANVGGGVTSVLRRSAAATFGNYATTSNNNLFYAGTPGATNVILNDNGTVYLALGPVATAGTFQNTVAPREALSVTEPVSSTAGTFFQSVTCGGATFLHLVNGLGTQAESGGITPNATTYATDYDGDIHAGSTGYAGAGTAPDIGADEFAGVSPAPSISGVSITPGGNQCTATNHVVSATITTNSGTISSASIVYTYNGVAQTPVVMTISSGNIWTGTIPPPTSPTYATVAWGIVATNSGSFSSAYTGTPYSDEPLGLSAVTATASATTICAGSPTTLTALYTAPGTATVGAGATTSATYPNPIYSNWANNKMQILYLASELNAAGIYAGNMSSLSLNLTSTSTTTRTAFTINMANVSATALTTTLLTPTFTQVYTNNYTPFVGANVFAFGTGSGSSSTFNWDGTSNLVLQICWDNIASTATESSTCTADNTSFTSVVSYNRTSTTGTSTCGITVAGSLTYSVRPRLIFGAYVASTPTSYLWSNGSTTNPTIVSPTTSTSYSATITALGCTKTTNSVAITVNPLPTAPTATNSSQCGIAIPTASVTSTSGAGSPQFYWYSAASGGTPLQTPPLANAVSSYYSNNFASSSLTNSSIAGAASISGGLLSLQPTTTSTGGSITVNASGINSTIFQTDFDLSLITTGTTVADGFSYSIGDDAIPLSNSTTPTAESGSGSKIRIAFPSYNTSGTNIKGIYLLYNTVATSYTTATTGLVASSTNTSWIPTAAGTLTTHVTVTINAAGQLTLLLGATTIFNNVQLPAGFLSADKSTWKHIFSSRSGGILGGFAMDNLAIQLNNYSAGYTTYQSSIAASTTFYVTEKNAGCESSPRTPVTANVTYGDAVAGVAQISGSNVTSFCLGSTFQLSALQTGSNSNAYTYMWTASSANSGITAPVSGGSFGSPVVLNLTPTAAGTYIYTVTYTDGVCNGVSTITIIVNPLPAISTITATPSTICAGSSASLSATSLGYAAGTATVGAGSTTTSTYNAPFYSLWSDKHEQILITAAELSAAGLGSGNITSISFPTTAGTVSNKDYTIKMAHTTATNVSTFVSGGFTTVYTTTAQAQTAGTNNTIAFTTPFNWDGTSNIVVELCWGDNTTTATLSSTSPADATAYVSVRVEYNTVATSGATICSTTGSTNLTYSVRPKILFGGQLVSDVSASLNWLWNPGGLIGSTVNASPSTNTTYTVVATNPTTTCSNSATVSVAVNPLPTAPTGTNSIQCGLGIPTASVASTSGAANPLFYWYSASSGGTLLQTPPFSNTLSTYFSQVFQSNTLTNASLSGAAAIGSGVLTLQPATTSSSGGLTVNAPGYNSNQYLTNFDLSLTATGTTIADGFSYSFGDDALATTVTPTAEHGSGSKLRIGFLTYNAASGSDGKGIYLMYNVSATTGYTSATPGVLAYSTDVSWIPTSATTVTKQVTATINALGQLTLTVGGAAIFTNVQLPPGFLSSDKSTWKHVFSSRSGGIAGGFAIDNLSIQANTYSTGYTTYQTAINTTTTFYVAEKDVVTGCESSPRTPVTVTVNYGDVVTPVAQISSSNITSMCMGSTFQLSTSQTGGNNNAYNYTWTASSANSGITGSVSGGTFASPTTLNVTPLAAGTYTYTITSNDGLCNDVHTISITVNPLPTITSATANPAVVCAGVTSTLTAITQSNTTAIIGTGTTLNTTTGYPSPYSNYYGGSKHQMLIKASELTVAGLTAGNIYSLAMDVSAVGSTFNGTLQNFQIDIKHTSSILLNGSTFETGLTTSATTVYGPVAQTIPKTGLPATVTHTFATPFNWDGTSNIIIQTSYSSANTGASTDNVQMPSTDAGFVSNNYYRADGSSAATILGATTPTGAGNLRPNMKLVGTTNSSGSLNWQWNPGALNGNVVNVTPSGTTIYTVKATHPTTGCFNTATASVTVNPLPAIPTANSSTQCGYAIPTATIASNSAAASPVFKWYDASTGGNLLQSSTSTTYTTAITTTTNFYVTELSAAGCESFPRVLVSANVTQPNAVSITSVSTSCIGSPISFTANQTGSSNTYVFTWSATPSTGSGISGSPTGTSQNFTPTDSGSYVYNVTAYDVGSNCTALASKAVRVYQGLSGTVSATQISGCTNPTGLITANVSGAGTVVNNDFTSSTLPSNMTSAGTGFAILGGRMQLTPNTGSQSGGVLIANPTGLANNDFQIDFDFITTYNASGNSDGLSYSYGDDVVALPSGAAATGTTGVNTLAAECGSGTKLKLTFDAVNNTGGCSAGTPGSPASLTNGNTIGVYLMYNSTTAFQGPTCPGVIYYDGGPSTATYTNYVAGGPGTAAGISWKPVSAAGATTHVTIKINALGQVSLWLNNVQVVFDQQLPASYLSANKANWKHAFAARTGANGEGHYIDNLLIQYNNFYEYSINGGTTWSTTNPIVPSTSGTYSVDARYVSVPACTANVGSATINTPVYTTTATATTYCTYSGTPPTLAFAPDFSGASYQWQSSPAGANTWSDIPGETNSNLTPSAASLSASKDFRIKLSCGGTPAIGSPSVPVTITSATPVITGTTPGSRCGTGLVTLSATASAGAGVKWFSGPTGGTALASGNSYTPLISGSTTFYAAATTAGFGSTQTEINTSTPNVTTTTVNAGVVFDLLQSTLISSVDVSSTAAGSVTIVLQDNAGTVIQGPVTVSGIVASTVSNFQTVPLNWVVAAGTGFRILVTSHTGALGYSTGVFPASLGSGIGSVTGGWVGSGTSTLNYFIYGIKTSTTCEGPRSAVIASITPAPAISVGHTLDSLCPGNTTNLFASSSNKSYVYTWTPGTSIVGSWVTVKPTVTTKYYVTAFQASTGCQNIDSVTVKVQPTATINPNSISICGGSTATITPTPSTGYAVNSVQWQRSSNNSTWTNVAGATTPIFTTPTVAVLTYFRMQVKNSTGGVCSQPTATVTVSNPALTSTTAASRCGTGTVTLAATANVNASPVWYAASTGGSPLGAGNSFVTPSITATTTYFAAAASASTPAVAGLSPTATTCGTIASSTLTDWPLRFNTTKSVLITSAYVIPVAAGTFVAALRTSLSATNLQTATFTFTAGQIGVAQLITLNFVVPSAGSYQLTNTTGGVYRIGTFTCTYPFNNASGSFSIVGSATTSTSATATTTYNSFYNISVSDYCESARIPVVATVNSNVAPTVSISGSSSTCFGAVVTYTATPANGGVAPSYQWKKDGVNVGTNKATYTDAGTTGGVITVVMTSNAPCASPATATSNSITLTVTPNAWTGTVSTNFSNPANWCAGVVPNGAANVSIPSGVTNMPKLTLPVTVNNLNLNTGATIDLGGSQLTVNGTLSGGGYVRGSISSNLIMTSSSVIGTLNMDPTANSLRVLNMTGAGILTLGNALDMYDSVDVNAGTLNTGGFMTLKSNQSGTARVGEIAANAGGVATGNITGSVTVERWLRNVSRQAFRLLSIPTSGTQTIRQAWQENQAPGVNGGPAGYGTMLTSTFGTAAGYDATSTTNSIINWDNNSQVFQYAGPTTSTPIATTSGWFVLVKGDRSLPIVGGPTNTTTLRTNGPLYKGIQPDITAAANQQTLVGNIYASAIDFTELKKSASITSFKVWDAVLSSSGSATSGAYQTFSAANGYQPTPGGGSYIYSGSNTRIESGQAFYVSPTSGGTITFTEEAKTPGSKNVLRDANTIVRFQANLNAESKGSASLADGNVTVFDNQYADAVDDNDATKLKNLGENLGISKQGKLLAVDARPEVTSADVIQYYISNLKQQQYSFSFTSQNMDAGLTAYLEDSYLKTSTPVALNTTVSISFTVTGDAASATESRFRIVFKSSRTMLPVTFVSIGANESNHHVAIDWKVGGQKDIRSYAVEHSTDGRSFQPVGTVTPNGSNAPVTSYNWLHEAPATGDNYYRIHSIGNSGDSKYSSVAKARIGSGTGETSNFVVAPNPVRDGNMSLLFTNQPEGSYQVRIQNNAGQVAYSQKLSHSGGNSTYRITLPGSLAGGIYKVEILKPNKERFVQSLVVGNGK